MSRIRERRQLPIDRYVRVLMVLAGELAAKDPESIEAVLSDPAVLVEGMSAAELEEARREVAVG